MIDGKRILAVVPARGGSKGLPLKNIRPALGIPLIVFTAKTIQECPFIDRAVVSTDHAEIARIAADAGLDAPFVRPPHLSGDRVGDWDVLTHALTTMENLDGKTYDVVLMLQPTTPVRTPGVIKATAAKLIQENMDSVWTVSPTDLKFHPLKQVCIRDGQMTYFDSRAKDIIARQQLEPIYHRNGMAYAFSRDCLLKQGAILGMKAGAVVSEEECIDIDNLDDFRKFERFLRNQEQAPIKTHS